MSIVTTKFLRKHYNEAVEDLEWQSSAFWQVMLQQAFYDPNLYAVTSESAPDRSLRRVDMVVKRYDEENDTLSALLWIEFKRPSGSVRDVEQQALDAAVRCIQKDNLMSIYAMTTVGVTFRMWYISKKAGKLEPLHGSSSGGDKSQYVDADSSEASIFPHVVDLIKHQIPLVDAPTLPSQSLGLLTLHNSEESAGPSNYREDSRYEPASQHQDMSHYSGSSQYADPQQYDTSQYGYDYDQDMAKAGKSSASGANETNSQQYVEVKVEKRGHTLSPDEFFFRDIKGKMKSTKKGDWTSITYQGHPIWIIASKKIIYFSRKKIA